jgi:hypothetical protein
VDSDRIDRYRRRRLGLFGGRGEKTREGREADVGESDPRDTRKADLCAGQNERMAAFEPRHSACRAKQPEKWFVYKSRLGLSLVFFLSSDGRVVCTERAAVARFGILLV